MPDPGGRVIAIASTILLPAQPGPEESWVSQLRSGMAGNPVQFRCQVQLQTFSGARTFPSQGEQSYLGN